MSGELFSVMDIMSATVDIDAVEPRAIRVSVRELREGDAVFDTTGGEHILARVTHFKTVTHTLREDGWADRWTDRDQLITIRRVAR